MSRSRRAGDLRVREAGESDSAAIATLAAQLGYPSAPHDIAKRMRDLEPRSQHVVFVAETESGEVIGWGHVSVNHLIESEMRAELNSLVVDDAHRSLGAGALLLQESECWARERGCQALNLRSNVIRTRAHRFYEKMGYENYKTQKAFRKML
jgi:GNAT superfamily N-acetyltransferase